MIIMQIVLTLTVSFMLGLNGLFVVSQRSSEEPLINVSLAASEPFGADTQAFVFPIAEPNYWPILDSQIAQPVLDARSALVYDVRSSRMLFEKNADQRFPIASITKLLSAVVVLESLAVDDIVTVPATAVRVDEEVQTLYEGERIRVGDLLAMMLIASSNDAAAALAAHATDRGIDFVAEMNRTARQIGMTNSEFKDPHGLDDTSYSTTHDLMRLAVYALRHEYLWELMREPNLATASVDGVVAHALENTNKLLETVPGVVGGKTGFTDGAGGCLLLVVDVPGRRDRIVSIVLGSGQRFDDTDRLVRWTRSAYRWE